MKSWNLSVSLKLIYWLRLKVMMSKIFLQCFLYSMYFLCTKEFSVKWLYFYKMKCIYTGHLGRFLPLYILPMLANLNPESRHFKSFSSSFGFSYLKELSLCHKLNFLIPLSYEPDGVHLWCFKLRLFDLPEFIVWNN